MRAMPMILQDGKFLEFRNAADEPYLPAVQLKNGEEARRAAVRAADELLGLTVPEDAVKEGFQARIGPNDEVVAIYPVDASKMEMGLLRPAEEIARWAWKDVPGSMGNVVALGFPRNMGERRNSDDEAENAQEAVEGEDGTRAGAGVARVAEAKREGPATARALIQGGPGSQILAARQNDGRLVLPGGHIEEGETAEQAACRELREEFGIDIASAMTGESYAFNGDDGSEHVAFVVDADKLDLSQVKPGDDVAEAEYVDAPFTDAHGATHAREHARTNAGESDWARLPHEEKKRVLIALDYFPDDAEIAWREMPPEQQKDIAKYLAWRSGGKSNDAAGDEPENDKSPIKPWMADHCADWDKEAAPVREHMLDNVHVAGDKPAFSRTAWQQLPAYVRKALYDGGEVKILPHEYGSSDDGVDHENAGKEVEEARKIILGGALPSVQRDLLHKKFPQATDQQVLHWISEAYMHLTPSGKMNEAGAGEHGQVFLEEDGQTEYKGPRDNGAGCETV
jgi:8-oxo-dGTP pyrophosphatase MutT (NUDIX family)